jgi:hypothetical protein
MHYATVASIDKIERRAFQLSTQTNGFDNVGKCLPEENRKTGRQKWAKRRERAKNDF